MLPGTDYLRRTARALAMAAVSLVLMMLGPDIHAQAPRAQAPSTDGTPTVNLTVEQTHIIKELVKELKVQPITVDAPSKVGDVIPESVVAQPIPVEVAQRVPQVRSHSFFVKDGHIVLVNPKDRRVSDVIE